MFKENVLIPIVENISKYPNRNAFCIDDTFYTYEDLGKNISKIRKTLYDLNIQEKNIGLVVNDDIETYASIFALWMEGKSYVSLHPNQPIERCVDVMTQISGSYILDSSEESRYKDYNVIKTKYIESSDDLYLRDLKGTDEDLTYILFTSGSTGRPKGVMISRLNVASFLDSFFARGINITEEDRCLQCIDLTFDISIVSYLAPLVKGACVYTVSPNTIKYSRVYELLEDYELTLAHMVPSTIRYLQPYFSEINLPKMRYCFFAGEALYVNIIEEWKKCVPNCKIFNEYGPTEATVYCTGYTYEGKKKSHNGVISIGRNYKNVNCIIIDEDNKIIQGSEVGELCVSGNQLTPGYFNNPEKNNECFFTLNGMRYYHTGDLVSMDKEGDLLYIGRKDSQAKIQGFRVELSEVEFHAKQFLKEKDAVAIAYVNDKQLTEIVMFIESEEFDVEDMVEYMRSMMPAYMIPTRFLFEKEFPLNVNGKTDRKKLRTLIR